MEWLIIRWGEQPHQLHTHFQPSHLQLQRILCGRPHHTTVHILRAPTRSALHAGCAWGQLRGDPTGGSEYRQRHHSKWVEPCKFDIITIRPLTPRPTISDRVSGIRCGHQTVNTTIEYLVPLVCCGSYICACDGMQAAAYSGLF